MVDHGEVFTPAWLVEEMLDLVGDDAEECRASLASVFNEFLSVDPDDEWVSAARTVLSVNIVRGDALTLTLPDGGPICFAEWGYLGKVKFQRRDFIFEHLTQRAAFEVEGSLCAEQGHNVFTPVRTFPLMKVTDLAAVEKAA